VRRLKMAVIGAGRLGSFHAKKLAAAEEVELLAVVDPLPSAAEPKYIEAVRASGFTFRSTDVGVVLDLMIHDIDLVLSMVRSPVRRVEALGLSVMGGHEDVANARLEFECGCVASLSASRVSYQPARWMHVWSTGGFAAIDFAARTTTLVRPGQTVLGRQLDVDRLTPQQAEQYREHLFEDLLPRTQLKFDAVDALVLEQEDFLASIRAARRPRVPGEAGRDAVGLAEQILERIRDHAWDARFDGRVGPLLAPRRQSIPAPHFHLAGTKTPPASKKAG
jgi:predicted dehydrogenase